MVTKTLGKKIFLAPPTYRKSKWEEEFQQHNVLIRRLSKNSCRFLKHNYFVNGCRCSTSTTKLMLASNATNTPSNSKLRSDSYCDEKVLPKLAALKCYFTQKIA